MSPREQRFMWSNNLATNFKTIFISLNAWGIFYQRYKYVSIGEYTRFNFSSFLYYWLPWRFSRLECLIDHSKTEVRESNIKWNGFWEPSQDSWGNFLWFYRRFRCSLGWLMSANLHLKGLESKHILDPLKYHSWYVKNYRHLLHNSNF